MRTKYGLLNSIPEKITTQVEVIRKIRAVNLKDAIEKVMLDHFLPDIYGNLRQFTRQTFRCKKCNEKYRRIPLSGKCTKCGGELTLAIYKGTIEKYLDIAFHLAKEYKLSTYMQQRLQLIKEEISSLFGGGKRQKGLIEFM